jgi:hypothetical protein
MSKLRPISEDLKRRITTAVAKAWEEGNPVAGQSAATHLEVAETFLRRWRSLSRRVADDADHDVQIRDLAKGLIDHFWTDPKLAPPVEYAHLASRLLVEVYSTGESGH